MFLNTNNLEKQPRESNSRGCWIWGVGLLDHLLDQPVEQAEVKSNDGRVEEADRNAMSQTDRSVDNHVINRSRCLAVRVDNAELALDRMTI